MPDGEIKVQCHWGIAEDVCIVLPPNCAQLFSFMDITEVRLTKEETVELIRQLNDAVEQCDVFEAELDAYKAGLEDGNA